MNMANALHQVLNQMLKQERWRKKPRIKGILVKISKTKSGSIKLTLKKKDEYVVYVLKRNKNLHEKALAAKEGDVISAAGRYWLGKMICEKLDNLGKGNKKYFDSTEKQTKLDVD